MKNHSISVILLTLIVTISCIFLNIQVFAQPTDELKVTVTKNGFNEFQDSLVIEKDIFENDIRLEEIFYSGYSLNNLKFDLDDIIASINLPEKTVKKPPSTAITALNYHKNIYELNISGKSQSTKLSLNPSAHIITPADKYKTAPNIDMQKAIKLITDKNYAGAEKFLDGIIILSDNTWNLAEIALLYEKIGKYNKSVLAYEKALKITPDRIELIYSYALCLEKINQTDRAVNSLLKIIGINPDFMLAHYNLGSIYYKKSDYYKALNEFYSSIKLNPLSADAFYNLALTLEVMNHKKLAHKYYLKCLELKPDDIQAIKAVQRLLSA
jgi:tetratricopeptide (TPR) repeat protein